MDIKNIDEIEGIEARNPMALKAVMSSVRVAADSVAAIRDAAGVNLEAYIKSPVYTSVVAAAAQTVSTLLYGAGAICNLDAPPADIGTIPDSGGNLILRCQHASPHEWKLDGTRIR